MCVCAHLQVCGTDAHLQARAGVTRKVRLSLLYSPIPDVTNLSPYSSLRLSSSDVMSQWNNHQASITEQGLNTATEHFAIYRCSSE